MTLLLAPAVASAGGGPANVLVLYNAQSADSAAAATHYATARSLPGTHRCGLEDLDPTATALPFAEYEAVVHPQIVSCLAAASHADDIDILVLGPDLPFVVDLPNGGYSTSFDAMLQIHEAAHVGDGTPLAGAAQNVAQGEIVAIYKNPSYLELVGGRGLYGFELEGVWWYTTAARVVTQANQPPSFRRATAGLSTGYDFGGQLFLVWRLEGWDLDDTMALIDRGVAADGTFPDATMLCMAGAQPARAARDPECEFVIQHLADADVQGTYLPKHDAQLSGWTVSAYLTGASNLRAAIDGLTYVPGAFADNLTSYGAVPPNFACSEAGECPAAEVQTSLLRFVRAGATGTHGTVAEPKNNCFPNAGMLLLYTMGYGLGESAHFAQRFVYWQNLYIGDPLASPWAHRPEVTVEWTPEGALRATAYHPEGIARVLIYVDEALVADVATAEAVFSPDASPGTPLEVLAVAVANNPIVERPSWAQPIQAPRPDIQGWAHATLVVPAPPVELPPPVEPAPEPTPQAEPPPPPTAEPQADGGAAHAEPPPPPPPASTTNRGCNASAPGTSAPGGAGLALTMLIMMLMGGAPGRSRGRGTK